MRKLITLFIILFTLNLNAQLQNDWDATSILQDMDKSWSVGNGCLEANYKVVNTNGLELNGNTLEVIDARIQVIGELTNFGEQVEPTHELIILSCSTSELVVYSNVLNVEDSALETLKIYPNPTEKTINISKEVKYTIYNINGKNMLQGKSKEIDISSFTDGIYFLVIDRKTYRIIKI